MQDIGIEAPVGVIPSTVEAPKPAINFTPLREFGKPTTAEPPRFGEPTTTPEINQLMTILNQGKPESPQEAVQQVEKNMPEEVKKNQGFLAKVLEWFFNFFTIGLFKKK